jgi:hypothetical protein
MVTIVYQLATTDYFYIFANDKITALKNIPGAILVIVSVHHTLFTFGGSVG